MEEFVRSPSWERRPTLFDEVKMTKEELKTHIETRYSECSKRSQGLSYGSFYDGYMDCYTELEKQNTEDINTLNKCVEYWKNKSEQLEEKLNKAKNYIKKDIDCAIKGSGVVTKEELQEMYDFIKEE